MPDKSAVRPLRAAILAALKSRDPRLLTSRQELTEDKVQAMAPLMKRVGATLEYLDANKAPDLGDDAVVIVEMLELMTPDARHLLNLAGYPHNYEVGAASASFLTDAQDGRPVDCGASEIGYLFYACTRDPFRRPVLWITGTSHRAMLNVTRWLTKAHLAGVNCPESYPDYPVEVIVNPNPTVGFAHPRMGGPAAELSPDPAALHNLVAKIACGDLEFDEPGRWKVRQHRTSVQLTYMAGVVRSIFVEGTELTRPEALKFAILAAFAEATQLGRWITIDQAQRAINGPDLKPEMVKRNIDCLHARIAEIRKQYPGLIVTNGVSRSVGYQLNAAIETIKEP
jgi:hypothetical protein